MAAAIIQKCYRGFRFRRVFGHYRQRLDTQMLCFLQQIEFINNDFFTKIVRTNYCVSLKAIESLPSPRPHVNNHRQSSKPLHYFFPPPPPLPLPSPFSVGGPTSAAPEASAHLKNLPPISLVPTPPPPPPLPPPAATFFPARHRVYRSPSPSTSKFAQVRDMFVRGEGSAVSASGGVSTTTIIHAQPPTKHPPSSSQTLPSIDQSRSPKALTVLNAVQEYQRQHINNHQQASKRFSHLGIGGSVNGVRPAHVGNQRSRATIQSNCNLPKPQIKQCLSMQAAPSPKQQQQQQQQQQSAKPITRVATVFDSSIQCARSGQEDFSTSILPMTLERSSLSQTSILLEFPFIDIIETITLNDTSCLSDSRPESRTDERASSCRGSTL